MTKIRFLTAEERLALAAKLREKRPATLKYLVLAAMLFGPFTPILASALPKNGQCSSARNHGTKVGTMVFMHEAPNDSFGSVTQILIGRANFGISSFFYGNKKVRIILFPIHQGKRISGQRYARISVYQNGKTIWHIRRWLAIPNSRIMSLGDGYRFAILPDHIHPGNVAHPTGKNGS